MHVLVMPFSLANRATGKKKLVPKKKLVQNGRLIPEVGAAKLSSPDENQSHPNAAARPGFKRLGRASTRKPYKARAAAIQNACRCPSWNSLRAKTFPFPKEMPSLWWQEGKEVYHFREGLENLLRVGFVLQQHTLMLRAVLPNVIRLLLAGLP